MGAGVSANHISALPTGSLWVLPIERGWRGAARLGKRVLLPVGFLSSPVALSPTPGTTADDEGRR